ncbi:MAG: hypothetical protein KBE04_07430 [Phycisphaerae bacterium]|nr:hypothetical protein [Phycisphaerae bacterium]
MYIDPGPIRPTHAAKVSLPRDRVYRGKEVLNLVMESPLSQRLSKAQRDFLATDLGIWVETRNPEIPNHYSIWLYAVSAEDAKTMARAILDTLKAIADRNLASVKRGLAEARQRLEQNQAVLPKKEEELKTVEKQYEQAKDAAYPHLNDEEASQAAKDTLLQMDREMRTLDIDLAGVQGKLRVIDQVLDKPTRGDGKIVNERIEALKTEQMIELSSIEAKRQAIEQVRGEQRRFRGLCLERQDLPRTIGALKEALARDKGAIERATFDLEHPSPQNDLLPLPVYQNKVLIYPIQPKDSSTRPTTNN